MPTILNHTVSDEFVHQAKAIRDKGGLCWLGLSEGIGGCTNCNGSGNYYLQIARGGPFDTPPNTDPVDSNGEKGRPKGSGRTAASFGGKWYSVQSWSFKCTACDGTGQIEPTRTRRMNAPGVVKQLADKLRI